MTTIKIKSNPYERKIEYFIYKEQSQTWEEIKKSNQDSRLREDESGKSFLPFKVEKIVNIILEEYYVGIDKINILFEGTQEEYEEVEKICKLPEISEKIVLKKTTESLENAKLILDDTKNIFKIVQPVIENIIGDDEAVKDNLNKVADALDDIIPICVFGNYSTGKSTFINSMIGHEILPSGGDPVTAKIYKIAMSNSDEFARIKFRHCDNEIELLYENGTFRIRKGNIDNEILCELSKKMEENKEKDMFFLVNTALEVINGYEKRKEDSCKISDVIEVEVPFAKEGILGTSRNKFVIFDTPGSNSNSNTDHSKILADALRGFSNGIPVWISQYEAIDSNDNAKLCDDVLNIAALDKRFTMIVLNKADSSELPEGGFQKDQINKILEYNSVEKMYAGGIYFVSSVMGLGAKNAGMLTDKHYRKIYRAQQEMFSDPEDVDYVVLHTYNIMPEQIKNKVIEYSEKCSHSEIDRIYINSGLFCIEWEMEEFASKYSAYNKCQMVSDFLEKVINQTNNIIKEKTEQLTNCRENRKQELEKDKQQLLDRLNDIINEKKDEFYQDSKKFVKSHAPSIQDYSYNHKDLADLDKQVAKRKEEENRLSDQKNNLKNVKDNMRGHLKENGKDLSSRKNIQSLFNLGEDFIKDCREIKENKNKISSSRNEIDKATSDEIIKKVVNKYKDSLFKVQKAASTVTKKHWIDNADTLKGILASTITGTDSLSEKQKEELSGIIIRHKGLVIDAEVNAFEKTKYLKGQILGFRLGSNERLNTMRLSKSYNNRIAKNIKVISEKVNENCCAEFDKWSKRLFDRIEDNIINLNPELKQAAEMIKEETDKIDKLKEDQKTISSALSNIRDLMDWKEFE